MLEFMTSRELYELSYGKNQLEIDQLEYVEVEGWVRTNRDNGSVGFIELNDGTYFRNIQVVYDKDLENYKEVTKFLTGTSLKVTGKFIYTPDSKQPFELHATEVLLIGACDEAYPLQKKRHTLEFLREIPSLRVRTNTFMAVFRLRSVLSMALHEFFQDQGFVYVHTPIITSMDGEGAGNMFRVTTIDDQDFKKDFFGKEAHLAVTGQLQVEAFCMAFRDVYTFGPTFRAENSNTTTHAAEFWMIEPEIAFADLDDDMDLMEDMVKYCIQYVLDNCPEEMAFFDKFIEPGLLERITKLKDSHFRRMTYTEAIDILKDSGVEFENKVYWGMDLNSEHERYICEKVVDGPVFLTDYPKEIKAFYMRLNDDQRTVAACDLLVPHVGELCGGSQREERYDVLKARMEELGMDVASYDWYLDLRKYGGCKHAGFGVGFERLIMYLSGMKNIRDVLPFPRTPKNLEL